MSWSYWSRNEEEEEEIDRKENESKNSEKGKIQFKMSSMRTMTGIEKGRILMMILLVWKDLNQNQR